MNQMCNLDCGPIFTQLCLRHECPFGQVVDTGVVSRQDQPVRQAAPPQLTANGAAAYGQMDRMIYEWRQVARENGQSQICNLWPYA